MSRAGRTTSGLALGSVASGLLAYGFFALTTHGLGAEPAAPLAVLWTYWAFAGAALTFPLQHAVARHLAVGEAAAVRDSRARVTAAVGGFSVLSGVVAWLLREPLFGRPDAWFPVLVVLVAVGSAVMGLVRGVAAGRRRYATVAASLVAENALRCLVAAAMLLAGVDDPVALGLALAAGPLVAVVWWPRLPPDAPAARPSSSTGPTGIGSGVGGLTASGAAQVVAQTVLTGAPVVLALSGGSPDAVTSLFAALALFRAPYLVALGAAPPLTVHVARATDGGRRRLDVGARQILLAGGGVGVLAGLAAAAGALLGPALVQLVFGATVTVSAGAAGVLAVGCVLAVANLLLMLVALAQARAPAVLATWGLAVLAAVATSLALASGSPLTLALGAFLAAEVAALVGLSVVTLTQVSLGATEHGARQDRGPQRDGPQRDEPQRDGPQPEGL